MRERATLSPALTIGLLAVITPSCNNHQAQPPATAVETIEEAIPGPPTPGLTFERARLVGSAYEERMRATRVTVRFELRDEEGRPVHSLSDGDFRGIEDGVPATSESLAQTNDAGGRTNVLLLLDCSKSMYDAPGRTEGTSAVVDMKAAAASFVERLQATEPGLCKFYYYRFAEGLAEVPTLDEIPDTYAGDEAGSRWTSLYHAVFQLVTRFDRPTIVLFSDGADNYSQNHGLDGVEDLARVVDAAHVPVNAIAFGNVAEEYDRSGVPGLEALGRLTAAGSLRNAREPAELEDAFQAIADHMLATYTFDYYSPNLTGEHTLALRVAADEREGSSSEFRFVASREKARRTYDAPDSVPEWEGLGPAFELPFFGLVEGAPLDRIEQKLGAGNFRWEGRVEPERKRSVCVAYDRLGVVMRFVPSGGAGGDMVLEGVREWRRVSS